MEDFLAQHFEQHKKEIVSELIYANSSSNDSKDIIIVVHNQLPYLKQCIESIVSYTTNYHLYIWDNNSNTDTEQYLQDLMFSHPDLIDVMKTNENIGYVEPNNQLAKWGSGDYIILLNSDTKVFDGWDKTMIGFLENNPEFAQVGYQGGLLDSDGKGGRAAFGEKIDYICGWCSCFSRKTYDQFGLFDPKLQFAYCEDSDFSIRLKNYGKRIYCLHTLLVHHYQNKTINEVFKEGNGIDLVKTFEHNHNYIRTKHLDYLSKKRIDLTGAI